MSALKITARTVIMTMENGMPFFKIDCNKLNNNNHCCNNNNNNNQYIDFELLYCYFTINYTF